MGPVAGGPPFPPARAPGQACGPGGELHDGGPAPAEADRQPQGEPGWAQRRTAGRPGTRVSEIPAAAPGRPAARMSGGPRRWAFRTPDPPAVGPRSELRRRPGSFAARVRPCRGPVGCPCRPRHPVRRPAGLFRPGQAREGRHDATVPGPHTRPTGSRGGRRRARAPRFSAMQHQSRRMPLLFRGLPPRPPPELQRMGLDHVSTGKNPPDEINVIIEIPKDAEPVKYEVDKESGAIFVDRVLSTPMRYPCNYGYVPNTLCG